MSESLRLHRGRVAASTAVSASAAAAAVPGKQTLVSLAPVDRAAVADAIARATLDQLRERLARIDGTPGGRGTPIDAQVIRNLVGRADQALTAMRGDGDHAELRRERDELAARAHDLIGTNGATAAPEPAFEVERASAAVAPPQRDAVVYLQVHASEAEREIAIHLSNLDLRVPDPRFTWRARSRFVGTVVGSLRAQLQRFADPDRLRELVVPADPYAVVDALRPSTGIEWRASIGAALAAQFEESVVDALRRLGGRYVAARAEGRSADAVVGSRPIDRLVHHALATTEPLIFGGEPARWRRDDAGAAVREVQLAWQGGRSRALWNWVRAIKPTDATVEEVAAALTPADRPAGEPATHRAYQITAAAPLFGLPPTWADQFPEARRYQPANHVGQDAAPSPAAVAASPIADEVALAQTEAPAADNASAAVAALPALLEDASIQLGFVARALAPWGLDVAPAFAFVARRRAELTTATPDQAARWHPVVTGQVLDLTLIGGAVAHLTRAADAMGLDRRTGQAHPFREILELLAQATACSHLATASRALIARAAELQAALPLRAVQASQRGLDTALDDLRTVPDSLDRQALQTRGVELDDRGRAIQSRLIAGEAVPADELDDHLIEVGTVTLESRVVAASHALGELGEAARAAGDGLAAELAQEFSDEFATLATKAWLLRGNLAWVQRELDDGAAAADRETAHLPAPQRAARRRAVRRESLEQAQQLWTRVIARYPIEPLLREGAKLIKWQRFRTACVRVVGLLYVQIGAGIAGAAAGAEVGMLLGAKNLGVVTELSALGRTLQFATEVGVDAAITSLGQVAITGARYSSALFDNLVVSLGTRAIMRLGKLAKAPATEPRDALGALLWRAPSGKLRQAGLLLLRETVTVNAHAMLGLSLNYVAARLRDDPTATMATKEEWLLQGGAIVVGHYIGRALGPHRQALDGLEGHAIPGARELIERSERLRAASDALTRAENPDPARALELLELHDRLVADELALVERLIADPVALGQLRITSDDLTAFRHDLHDQAAAARSPDMIGVRLRLAGLEELVPGEVWKGTPKAIAEAIRAFGPGRDGPPAKVFPGGRWRVTIGGHELELVESAPPARPAEPAVGRPDNRGEHYAIDAEGWDPEVSREFGELTAPAVDDVNRLIEQGALDGGDLDAVLAALAQRRHAIQKVMHTRHPTKQSKADDFGRRRGPDEGGATPLSGKYAPWKPRIPRRTRATLSSGERIDVTGTRHGFEAPPEHAEALAGGFMVHTDPDHIDAILAECRPLYRTAIDPATPVDATVRAVGELHWWLAHAMPYARGSAAITDMLAKSIFLRRGIQVSRYRPGVSPDLDAFTMPDAHSFGRMYPTLFVVPPYAAP